MYCVTLYCYGNASPIDTMNNPILPICSIRKYNPGVPIIVLCGADNLQYFRRYASRLHFQTCSFKPRANGKLQMCYKLADSYALLKNNNNFDGILVVDTDVMWHRNTDEFVLACKNHSDTQRMSISEVINTGVCYIDREVDVNIMSAWEAVCHLLAQSPKEVSEYIVKKIYPGPYVHDESCFQLLISMLGDMKDKIFYYPEQWIYMPHKDVSPNKPSPLPHCTEHYAKHFSFAPFSQAFTHLYSAHLWDKIGRTGALLGIEEYDTLVQQMLKSDYSKFMSYLPVPAIKQSLAAFMQYWYNLEISNANI